MDLVVLPSNGLDVNTLPATSGYLCDSKRTPFFFCQYPQGPCLRIKVVLRNHLERFLRQHHMSILEIIVRVSVISTDTHTHPQQQQQRRECRLGDGLGAVPRRVVDFLEQRFNSRSLGIGNRSRTALLFRLLRVVMEMRFRRCCCHCKTGGTHRRWVLMTAVTGSEKGPTLF
jgi:hypothetical protein